MCCRVSSALLLSRKTGTWRRSTSGYRYLRRFIVISSDYIIIFPAFLLYFILAGHPRSGCPARLRGHNGSGLWKVWTVPSPPLPSLPSPPSPPLPSPPLPCPALPCPALPCPALPCPALPCPALPCPALPCPALPCPALPCPALPCPALPCPALPCPPPALPLPCPALPSPPLPSPPLPSPPLPSLPPSLPPSRVPNLIKLGPAVWPKLQPAEARECSAALAISEWTRRLSAMLIIARRKMLFWKRRITRAVIRIGTNEWPIAHPAG